MIFNLNFKYNFKFLCEINVAKIFGAHLKKRSHQFGLSTYFQKTTSIHATKQVNKENNKIIYYIPYVESAITKRCSKKKASNKISKFHICVFLKHEKYQTIGFKYSVYYTIFLIIFLPKNILCR